MSLSIAKYLAREQYLLLAIYHAPDYHCYPTFSDQLSFIANISFENNSESTSMDVLKSV